MNRRLVETVDAVPHKERRGFLLLDCYNRRMYRDVSFTILEGMDYRNLYFLIEYEDMEENGTARPRPEGKGWINEKEDGTGKWYRIRKLTTRECFRLMDVDEKYIDRMMAKDENGKQLVSNTRLYRAAGNSIVVSCMYHIFRQLWFPEKSEEDGWKDTLF